jgi:hypothetical protein
MKPKNAIESLPVAAGDALDFPIEDGVPMPVKRSAAKVKRYFPFDKLKSGQSFLVEKDRRKGLRPSLARFYKDDPTRRKTIVMREQPDGSVRVQRK